MGKSGAALEKFLFGGGGGGRYWISDCQVEF